MSDGEVYDVVEWGSFLKSLEDEVFIYKVSC